MVKTTIQTFGRLDFPVNNAGVSIRPVSTVEIDEAKGDRIININLKSVWLCADLAGTEDFKIEHLAKAIQYRGLDREGWMG